MTFSRSRNGKLWGGPIIAVKPRHVKLRREMVGGQIVWVRTYKMGASGVKPVGLSEKSKISISRLAS